MAGEGYSSPQASGLTKHSVYKLAENVALQLGFEPGGDLFDALEKLGGRLSYKDFSGFGETDSGSLVVHGEGNFEVNLAKNTSPTRDRFTIAHEIGHYVLHFLWPRKQKIEITNMIAERYGSDRTEWEANWFAAAFLMPENEFRTAIAQANGDLSEVADKFGVSNMAARVRAEALRQG
ncbi:ImmA/IrrE family metallo-endopeptidase [Azospirillum doebereinerae]|uniref:ImmA/IrrE family metallo-endopeptidase n=1 Tax=Azospirillum doebereinerae TaxID=92933 RepID=UPI001EE5B87A|nr:ImmA/IrrE family metallo-endopeptidase [Azospirillum doebereinerae]MCG5242715.1 ImmA/IrrE family metallo-endopeptidase [Azospirillum doebereinerae]